MKKALAVVLVIAVFLSLAACNKDDDDGASVLGTWEGTMNYGPMVAAALPVKVQVELPVYMTFTFYEDDRYTRTVDQESLADAIHTVIDACMDAISELYQEQGISLEDALAAQGMTVEEFREEALSSAELEAMFRLAIADHTAYYNYESGRIYFAETKKAFDEEEYVECLYVELSDNSITITDIEQNGEKLSETIPGMFPAVFQKAQ